MVFGKKSRRREGYGKKTLAPIPGKAFGVSGKQKKATGTTVPGKASVSKPTARTARRKNRLLLILAAMAPASSLPWRATTRAAFRRTPRRARSSASQRCGSSPSCAFCSSWCKRPQAAWARPPARGFAALIRASDSAFASRHSAMFALLVGNVATTFSGVCRHRIGHGDVRCLRSTSPFQSPR